MNISLVLLAAGNSRRFEGNKLLSTIDGKPMYLYIADEIEKHCDSLFAQKIVVSQYEEILREMGRRGYTVLENPKGGDGIASSLKIGLDAATGQAVCFAVCDQPYLKGDTIAQFLKCWEMSGRGMGCLSFEGVPGNPAVFSERYFEELRGLKGDAGGRKILSGHPADRYMHEIKDKKELEDIDIRRKL